MNAILFGFKSAGKTYLGKLLAQETGRQFIDTDEEIIKVFGIGTIRDICQALGEQHFRSLESQVIFALEGVTNAVISVGGGAVLKAENVECLKKIGKLIFLDASFQLLEKRIAEDGAFSFASKTPLETIFRERQPIYQSIEADRINVESADAPAHLAALKKLLNPESLSNGL